MTQLLFPLGPTDLSASSQTWPPVRSRSTYAQSHRHLQDLVVTPLVNLPAVFTPAGVGGDLPFAALIFDGALTLERPGVAVYANEASTPLVRALTCGLPHTPGLVLGRATAAWVHTGQYPPAHIDVLYERGYSPPALAGRPNFARSTFKVGDVQPLGPVRVTNPVRTVMDLAAWCTPQVAARHIFSFQAYEHLIVTAQDALEGSHNFRNKIPALELLNSLARRGELV